jgi:hypothetical protein
LKKYAFSVSLFICLIVSIFLPETADAEDVVLATSADWYYGDLHSHSTYSDGRQSLDFTLDFAHEQGMDFIAVSDHNTIGHFAEVKELQARYDDMLVLYAYEFTTGRGHANVFNYTELLDYHKPPDGYDINALIDQVHKGGGYFSPNHPSPSFAGLGFNFTGVDWRRIDYFEVVNGYTKARGFMQKPENIFALKKLDSLIRQGYRITAISGSDDHHSGQHESPTYTPIGVPVNAVYAQELSADEIFSAMKKGHCYIINRGKAGPRIDFTAESSGRTAMMGDAISGNEIIFRVKVDGAKNMRLKIVENGLSKNVRITSDPFEFSFNRAPSKTGYVRLEVKSGVFHEIITNPIYYGLKFKRNSGEKTNSDQY